MKLAVLTAGELLLDLPKKIENLHPIYSDVEFQIFDYKNFSYISTLYKEIHKEFDGFILSGPVPYYALKKGVSEPLKPTVALTTNLEGVYHSLFKLLNERRDLNLDKVLIDVINPESTSSPYTASMLLNLAEPIHERKALDAFWISRTLEELTSMEEYVYNTVIQKWNMGEVDYVFSRFPSIYPRLQQRSIPCSFIYPSTHQLKNAVKECIDSIHLAEMRDYMPAVIAVFKKNLSGSDAFNPDMDMDILELQKELLNFNQEYLMSYQLQKNSSGFYVFTNLKTVNRITQNLSSCNLTSFLNKTLTFQVNLAYGFAKDIGQAKANAVTALMSASKDGHVYVVNEAGILVGPLDSKTSSLPLCDLTPEIQEIACRSKLSPLTVQKLKTIIDSNGSSEITIAELSEKLGVKQRNANRILTNLLQSNDVEISGTKASGTKGRPTKIYHFLCFD